MGAPDINILVGLIFHLGVSILWLYEMGGILESDPVLVKISQEGGKHTCFQGQAELIDVGRRAGKGGRGWLVVTDRVQVPPHVIQINSKLCKPNNIHVWSLVGVLLDSL